MTGTAKGFLDFTKARLRSLRNLLAQPSSGEVMAMALIAVVTAACSMQLHAMQFDGSIVTPEPASSAAP